jgi:5-methylcytosine-specific restriction endonuclease McrA
MGKKVLVLNADYRAVTVCSPEKAFILVLLDKAEIIYKSEGYFFRSVSRAYPIPSVIRLRQYVNVPFRGVMLNRQNIFRRDNFTCVYCGSKKDLTLDHVLPKSRKGASSWQNLVTACKKCNSYKGDHTPEEVGLSLPYKPYKPTFLKFIREFSKQGDETWDNFLQ